MPYCTPADIEAVYGREELLRAQPRTYPPVDPPVVSAAAVDAAIEAATVEIDSYVMARHRLPLPDALAARLKNRCVDIAMYHLASSVSGGDDLKRRRYEDAVAWLAMLARGEVVLEPRRAIEITSEPQRDFRLPTNYFDGPYDGPYPYRGRRYGGRYSRER